MDTHSSLKVVVLPWLAMGHLIPFLELSKSLAKKGIKVYFITTPKNIARLPKIPPYLSSNLRLISFPLPYLEGVPNEAESSMDVPPTMQPKLKTRFDLLRDCTAGLLEELRPDWVIYDFTSHWIPSLSAKIGASCAYLALFNAASLTFFGSPCELIGNYRSTPEDFAVVPRWVPMEMESKITYHMHEVLKFLHSVDEDMGTPDTVRFGSSIEGCDFVCIRSAYEFESKWLQLLSELYGKTVIPIGFLFPDLKEFDGDEKWVLLENWLDEQEKDSVLYVALGSESPPSQEELTELANGLEHSNLPFLLVLRDLPGSTRSVLDMLPNGFLDRVANRGLLHFGWAPQVRILSHPSIGGFLTHCGWNSVIEGLGLGRVLVLFPLMNDQGLVARMMVTKGLGVEVARDEPDGSLRWESVTKAIRLAMVEKEGEVLRANARKMKGVFGNKDLNHCYVEQFIRYLVENKKSNLSY
uniref:Glycosyltransferase N-terminal domain-containing protein n=1 Tax=Opuntia streptacantha TaxID=393608 RepID=A0A7C8ZS39_OPUST